MLIQKGIHLIVMYSKHSDGNFVRSFDTLKQIRLIYIIQAYRVRIFIVKTQKMSTREPEYGSNSKFPSTSPEWFSFGRFDYNGAYRSHDLL